MKSYIYYITRCIYSFMASFPIRYHKFSKIKTKHHNRYSCHIFRSSILLLKRQTDAGWKYNTKREYFKQSAHIHTSPPYCSGQEALVPAHAKNNSHAGCLTPAHRLPALELQPASHIEAQRPVACLLTVMVLDKHQNKVWDGLNTIK